MLVRTTFASLATMFHAALALSATVPFVEEFAAGSSDWFDAAGTAPLSWSGTGGPDDSSHALGTFNFAASAEQDSVIIFRAQDEFGSSGGAFQGDWITDGVAEFRAFVRHDAAEPLPVFVRFSSPPNFPGAVAVNFVPVPPDTWTEIVIPIDLSNPQFISFEGSDFASIFSDIGHIQIGVSVTDAVAGVDRETTFDLDKAAITGCATTERRLFLDEPSDDRWHYPFNFTPGSRATGTCFGAAGLDGFNDRDGALIVAWNTSESVQPGRGPDSYDIRSITITLTDQASPQFIPQWPIDLSVDLWPTYLPGGADQDPGRPLELFGAGFDPPLDAESWTETEFFVGSSSEENVPRNPFPFVFQDGTSDLVHVEDNVKGLDNQALAEPLCGAPHGPCPFSPTPWAIGVPIGYRPGNQTVPFDVRFTIDLELSDGAVRRYFQEQLDSGRVIVYVTSLSETVVMGPASGSPSFFMKEGLGLDPRAKAASLALVLATGVVGDLDHDGFVDLPDWSGFIDCLNGPGLPPSPSLLGVKECLCVFDFDADGDIDLSDVGEFVRRLARSQ